MQQAIGALALVVLVLILLRLVELLQGRGRERYGQTSEAVTKGGVLERS